MLPVIFRKWRESKKWETEGLFCYKSGRYSQSPQGRKSRRNPRNVHDL